MEQAGAASVGGFFALRGTPVPGGAHRPLALLYAGRRHRSRPASTPLPPGCVPPSAGSPRPSRTWGWPPASGRPLWDRPSSPVASRISPLPHSAGIRSTPRRTTCGSTPQTRCRAPRTASASASSTATSYRSRTRSNGTDTSHPGCCGAMPARPWPGAARADHLGPRPPAPRRSAPGPHPGRRTLRPPGPADHRDPAHPGIPQEQLLPLLPVPGRRPLRGLRLRLPAGRFRSVALSMTDVGRRRDSARRRRPRR